MKEEDIYRNLKFIGITVAGGVALIYLLFAFVSNPFRNADFRTPQISNKDQLENNLESFNKNGNNFNPEDFPVLLTKITSSGNNGLIQKSTMNYLSEKLIDSYKTIIYDQCDNILIIGLKYYSINQPLADLEKIIGKDDKIEYFRKQIYWLGYYSNTFKIDVDNYVNRYPTSFEVIDYKRINDRNQDAKIQYKKFLDQEFGEFSKLVNSVWINKAENAPQLESKYIYPQLKNILENIKQKLIRLEDSYKQYKMLPDPNTYNSG